MKRIFILTCLMLSSVLTFAQTTKKVAILEVVDREGRLSYGNKMMLRSNLARAITNTAGYEAYDRTDIDAIMSEHDFQRTGLVSEDQIKQLGHMTGVSLILVTEGALVGNNSMFVSAKILNVETAKVEMMDNITMGLETMAMQQGCTTLANHLLNVREINQNNIERKSNQYRPMSNNEYEWFLLNNCPQAYKLHKSGKQMITAGWVLFSTGLAMAIGGGVILGIYDSDHNGDFKNLVIPVGIPLLTIGVGIGGIAGSTLLGVGYKRRKKAYEMYHNSCVSSSVTPIIFNLTAGQNGLGLAMQF